MGLVGQGAPEILLFLQELLKLGLKMGVVSPDFPHEYGNKNLNLHACIASSLHTGHPLSPQTALLSLPLGFFHGQ